MVLPVRALSMGQFDPFEYYWVQIICVKKVINVF